jgi:WD40 repeat protein
MYKYLIFEILECKYFFAAGYLDQSFKIYTKEKDKNIMYSIYTESNVTCIRNMNNTNVFFTGHQNGKINKWAYSLINKENLKKENNQMSIDVCRKNSIYGHLSFVKIIEINEKMGIIVSAGADGLIFVRKIYDFELLSYIKFNKNEKEIIDINCHKQIIIISIFKIKSKKFLIYTYSLNGIKLGKISEQVKLPISIIPESDDIFVFGCFNIYLIKISMKEKISLIIITNDLNPCYIEGGKEERDIDEDEEDNDTFNEDFCKTIPISYFYDTKNHVLFCLFANGKLHRVNLIKNM